MIEKIMCFFGLHDYGDWKFLGYIPAERVTKSSRRCKRQGCVAVEILTLRRDK